MPLPSEVERGSETIDEFPTRLFMVLTVKLTSHQVFDCVDCIGKLRNYTLHSSFRVHNAAEAKEVANTAKKADAAKQTGKVKIIAKIGDDAEAEKVNNARARTARSMTSAPVSASRERTINVQGPHRKSSNDSVLCPRVSLRAGKSY